MAGTIFIDFGSDIKGDSSDTESKGMIVIDSFEFGGTNATSPTRVNNEAATVGRVQLAEVIVAKAVDKTTPHIFSFLCQGKMLAEVTVYMYKASQSGSDVDFVKISLTDCVISTHDVHCADGDGTETFSINYGTIVTQVTPSEADTGKPGTAVPKGYDRAAQTVKDK